MTCKFCSSTTSWEDCRSNWQFEINCTPDAHGRARGCFKKELQATFRPSGTVINEITAGCFKIDTLDAYCSELITDMDELGYDINHCSVGECPNDECSAGTITLFS